jgi:hypothetical protein
VYRALGLGRDPFAPDADPALYWESQDRAEARKEAVACLERARGIWVCGPPGAGRGEFLRQVAGDLALQGRGVLWADGTSDPGGEALLRRLLATWETGPLPDDLLKTAGDLYEGLLRAFASSGPVPCFPGPEPLEEGALFEARLLGGLRVAGSPIVALALCGSGEPPLEGMASLSLGACTESELAACVTHRCSVSGRPDLLTDDELTEIVGGSFGIGEALRRARRALHRKLFREPPSRTGSLHERPFHFDPRDVEEAASLLESLSPTR